MKHKRCSKCQQPVKGHYGPTGTKCINQTDDVNDVELDHEQGQASARPGDENPGTSATMPKEQIDILVNIMTSINLNMEVTCIHKSNRDILKALIATENSQSAMATPRVGVASTSPNSNYTDNIVWGGSRGGGSRGPRTPLVPREGVLDPSSKMKKTAFIIFSFI